MPREQSRAALKRAAILTVSMLGLWLLIGVCIAQTDPAIRDIERQLNRHLLDANIDYQQQRIARLEVAVAANTVQLNDYRAYGAVVAIILVGMNALNLVGWKVNVIRNRGNGS